MGAGKFTDECKRFPTQAVRTIPRIGGTRAAMR